MKKIFQVAVVALVGLAGYNANAQESSLAVRAGVNFNTLTGENTDKAKSNIGFHAGVTYEMQLGDIFYVEPGVYFDTVGYKDEKILGKTVNMYAVTVPVLARVKFQVGDALSAFFNAGPYMSVGLSGKEKTHLVGTVESSKDIEFGSNKGEYSRIGFGLNFGAGVEVSRFIVSLGYDLGLTETAKDSKVKFSSFKIGVGYKF